MSTIQPKAIFIGPEKVGNALPKIRKDWNFLSSVNSIDAIYDGWDTGEITRDIEVILVFSKLFDPAGNNNQFEEFISGVGPYALIGIVNYDPQYTDDMRERINKTASQLAQGEPHYYFVNPKQAKTDLNKAVEIFTELSDDSAQDSISILKGEAAEEEITRADDSMAFEEPQDEYDEFLEDNGEESEYIGKVISGTSGKGGVGKSSTTESMAAELAKRSKEALEKGLVDRELKIIIIDMDVRDGQLGFITGYNQPTAEHLHRVGLDDQHIEKAIIHNSGLGVDLLLAPKQPRASLKIPSDFYAALIKRLKKKYDYIFLDTSVNYLEPLLNEVCYPMSDIIFMITEPIVASVFSMTRWILETTNPKNRGGLGIPKSKIKIVINKFLPEIDLSANKIIRSAQGIDVVAVIPSMPRAVAKATNKQELQTMLEIPGWEKPMRRITDLIVEGDNYRLA